MISLKQKFVSTLEYNIILDIINLTNIHGARIYHYEVLHKTPITCKLKSFFLIAMGS
jgi:hypothetical protein